MTTFRATKAVRNQDLNYNGCSAHFDVYDTTNPLDNPATNRKKTFKHVALPWVELVMYFVVMVGFLSYMMYRTSVISKEFLLPLKLPYLPKGWLPIGHGKIDISDFEWIFFKRTGLQHLPSVAAVVIYIIGGRCFEAVFPKYRNHFILIFGIVALTFRMSPRTFAFFASHTAAAYLASRTGNKKIVWIVATMQTLSVVSSVALFKWQERMFPGFAIEMIGFTFGIIRTASFGLECCGDKAYGLFDFLLYVFYFPMYSFGPPMTFDKFYIEINKECRLLNKHEIWNIVRQFLRLVFWFVYIEVLLHFLYINAFHRNMTTLRRLPPGDLAVLAGNHMLFFQNKYVLMYGVPGVIALFDRVHAPQPPLCPMGVYSFREMWRNFDRGLHDFLMRYIYIPLGGSKYGSNWAAFSSFVSFCAMGLWHGNSDRHYLWAFCNWLGILLETRVLGATWSASAIEYQCKLSGAMLRRVCGVFAAVNQLMLSVFSLVFILGSLPIFQVYFYGVFVTGFPWMPLILFFFYYFNVQLDFEVQRRFAIDDIYSKKYV